MVAMRAVVVMMCILFRCFFFHNKVSTEISMLRQWSLSVDEFQSVIALH